MYSKSQVNFIKNLSDHDKIRQFFAFISSSLCTLDLFEEKKLYFDTEE